MSRAAGKNKQDNVSSLSLSLFYSLSASSSCLVTIKVLARVQRHSVSARRAESTSRSSRSSDVTQRAFEHPAPLASRPPPPPVYGCRLGSSLRYHLRQVMPSAGGTICRQPALRRDKRTRKEREREKGMRSPGERTIIIIIIIAKCDWFAAVAAVR